VQALPQLVLFPPVGSQAPPPWAPTYNPVQRGGGGATDGAGGAGGNPISAAIAPVAPQQQAAHNSNLRKFRTNDSHDINDILGEQTPLTLSFSYADRPLEFFFAKNRRHGTSRRASAGSNRFVRARQRLPSCNAQTLYLTKL
jgi:hypothetical protein